MGVGWFYAEGCGGVQAGGEVRGKELGLKPEAVRFLLPLDGM